MSLAAYTTALTTFTTSPTEANKTAVLMARAALPDAISGEGGTVTLPNISTLEAALSAAIVGATRTDRRRLIRTGLSHEG